MDAIKKLPREVQVTLGALVLYVIFSFFDWQQVSIFGHTGGFTLWHGFGIVVGKTVDWYLSALVSKNRTRKGCRRLPGESVAHQLLADPRPVEAGKPRQFRSSVLAVGFVG